MLRVTNDGGDFQVEVLLLSESRGPASVAQNALPRDRGERELRLRVYGCLADRCNRNRIICRWETGSADWKGFVLHAQSCCRCRPEAEVMRCH
jgi:hypothetical protein